MYTSFNANDIHKLRLDLATRFSNMSSDEAERVFKETVRTEKLAIESAAIPPVSSMTKDCSDISISA